MSLALFLTTFITYLISSNGETGYNYFSRLAFAFSQGEFFIHAENVPYLNELIPISENIFFVPYAPFPGILLTPIAYLQNSIPSQTFFSILLSSILAVVIYQIALEITSKKSQAIFVAILASFGTNIWFNGSVGSTWYFGQIVSLLFLSSAVLSRFKNNLFVTGIFLGASYLARPHTILALPFFVLFDEKFLTKNIQELTKTMFKFGKKGLIMLLGILPFLLFNFYYNFVRFGEIWDKGYTLIPGVLDEPWFEHGIFHWSYIPRHIEVMLFALPSISSKTPFIIPSLAGMAIWITTPAFLIILFSDFKKRIVKMALLASILVITPVLMHGTTGFTQFGYRYAMESYVFFFIAIAYALKKHKIKKIFLVLLAASIIVNLWGVVMINKLGIFV